MEPTTKTVDDLFTSIHLNTPFSVIIEEYNLCIEDYSSSNLGVYYFNHQNYAFILERSDISDSEFENRWSWFNIGDVNDSGKHSYFEKYTDDGEPIINNQLYSFDDDDDEYSDDDQAFDDLLNAIIMMAQNY